MIKIGRRGSLNGDGPWSADKAIPPIRSRPTTPSRRWRASLPRCQGRRSTRATPPSTHAARGDVVRRRQPARNVIPGEAKPKFNVRFNDIWTPETLAARIRGSLGSSARRRRARDDPSDELGFVPHAAFELHGPCRRGDREADRPYARTLDQPAVRQMRVSSRIIARCWNSASSARRSTRPTRMWKSPISKS